MNPTELARDTRARLAARYNEMGLIEMASFIASPEVSIPTDALHHSALEEHVQRHVQMTLAQILTNTGFVNQDQQNWTRAQRCICAALSLLFEAAALPAQAAKLSEQNGDDPDQADQRQREATQAMKTLQYQVSGWLKRLGLNAEDKR